MKKKIVLFLVLFCFISMSLCFPQSSSDRCNDPPPPGPPPDKADDNYSFNLEGSQSTTIPTYFELYPFIGIFKNGNVEAMDNLLEKFGRGCLYVEKSFSPEVALKHINTLVIPTGGFFDFEKSAYLKLLLEQFVAQGGIIICFAQQETEDFDLLPRPMEESLKAYGWREDQSCLKNSVYFDSIHPVLSSSGSQLVDAGVDGYFADYPANTTILLQRVTNREPALIMYPYGNGYVILTSMFSDWAYAHSQTSTSELNIVRDLVTFCKDPNSSIPMFDLSQHPAPDRRKELRTLGVGAQILVELGIRKMRVMSAPISLHGLNGFDLEVVEFVDHS